MSNAGARQQAPASWTTTGRWDTYLAQNQARRGGPVALGLSQEMHLSESTILDKPKTLGPPSTRLVLCKVAIPPPSCDPTGWRLLSRLRWTRLVVIGSVFPDLYVRT